MKKIIALFLSVGIVFALMSCATHKSAPFVAAQGSAHNETAAAAKTNTVEESSAKIKPAPAAPVEAKTPVAVAPVVSNAPVVQTVASNSAVSQIAASSPPIGQPTVSDSAVSQSNGIIPLVFLAALSLAALGCNDKTTASRSSL